jgi:hypothetical protein
MTYRCGWITEMAPDPVPLGTFVRCTLEHPELFQFTCPACGRTLLPYRYNGSPLSGRVDLEGKCACGWEGARTVSGWQLRSQTLRDTLRQDRNRLRRFRICLSARRNLCAGAAMQAPCSHYGPMDGRQG